MDSQYPVEEDIPFKKIEFPHFSRPCILNKKLEKDEKASKLNVFKIIFKNNIYYEISERLLCLPNGETFKGELSKDFKNLDKGTYTWKDGQNYYGRFNKNNNFSTNEGEISKITFSNGETFEGSFENGEIGDGKYKTNEGNEIQANFQGGKINGFINYKDKKNNFTFEGYLIDNKKEAECFIEVKIKNKIYSISGEYNNGKKNGMFIIREMSPNIDYLYIKGNYKDDLRHGYFDITDKNKGIFIKRQYISFYNMKLINDYNKKYKTQLTGNENSISFCYTNNPIHQLNELVKIGLNNLLTLDISRANIKSISFLNTKAKTLFSLKNLILNNNKITNLEPLVDVYYPNLKKLVANDNGISNIICIKNFKFNELEELVLSSNPIKSLQEVEMWMFPNLLTLSLSRTKIKNIEPLCEGNFPNLVEIDLYLTPIQKKEEIIPQLKTKFVSLRNIILEKSF